jgi:hypothetical protein
VLFSLAVLSAVGPGPVEALLGRQVITGQPVYYRTGGGTVVDLDMADKSRVTGKGPLSDSYWDLDPCRRRRGMLDDFLNVIVKLDQP